MFLKSPVTPPCWTATHAFRWGHWNKDHYHLDGFKGEHHEKERNKAFFGTWPAAVAPLQIVTPPIMRLPVAGLRAFLDNDYEKLAQYHVYTMMPFGRMIRDVSPMAKGNLIENPSRLLEKSMGFPLGDLQAMARKIKKGDLYYPRSFDE